MGRLQPFSVIVGVLLCYGEQLYFRHVLLVLQKCSHHRLIRFKYKNQLFIFHSLLYCWIIISSVNNQNLNPKIKYMHTDKKIPTLNLHNCSTKRKKTARTSKSSTKHYDNSGYPSYYLDYGPQNCGYYSPRSYCSQEMYYPHSNWQVAQHDVIEKGEMYTQTSKINDYERRPKEKENGKPVLENKGVQSDVIVEKRIQQNYGEESRKRGYMPTEAQYNIPNRPSQYEDRANIGVIPYKSIMQPQDIKIAQTKPGLNIQRNVQTPKSRPKQPATLIEPIIEENSRSSEVNNNQQHLPNPKKDVSLIEQNRQKTFSEQILDELFEKDLQQQYEQKYNSDKRYAQVIIGNAQKTVKIKDQITNRQYIQERREVKFVQNNQNRNIQRNDRHYENNIYGTSSNGQLKQQNSYNLTNEQNQIHNIGIQSPRRALQNEKTINLHIKSQQKPHNFRNSLVQTNEQSNQQSRNQVMQTDNSQSTLVIEKLIRNVIDDKQFRRRINQKTDEFNRIKVDFDENPEINVQGLVNTKEIYARQSKEFLSRLNQLIDGSTFADRIRRTQVFNFQRVSTEYQIPNQYPPLPPRSSIPTNKNRMVPASVSSIGQIPVPVSVTQMASPNSRPPSQSYLQVPPPQHPILQNRVASIPVAQTVFSSIPFPPQRYPHPSQIIEQVVYRSPPRFSTRS